MLVSIVIPTRNESANIYKLLQSLKFLKEKYNYEAVVVDDSEDNTALIASENGARVIKGKRKGLASAVIDGINGSNGEYIVVMDADLQHPPHLVADIIENLKYHDLVVATKHAKGAKSELSGWRKLQSNLGVFTAQVLVPAPISDPMSGFFGVRRKCLDGIDLEGIGFKIGLEIIVKSKWVSHNEVPMEFRAREAGISKGTMHSLQKHLWRLFRWSLDHTIELPMGSQEYFNFYEGSDWQKKWKQSIAELLSEISQNLKPSNILDTGCGSSPNINYLHAKEKIGIDINEKALEFIGGYSDAKFRSGSILNIPFPGSSFDMVTCIEVLEHLHQSDTDKAMKELTRVLKPKGYAIIATPNYASVLWNIIEKSQQILQPKEWTSDHYTKYNRQSLSKLCQAYGLKEVRYDGVMNNMDMVITYEKGG